jgi:hypothetical protein
LIPRCAAEQSFDDVRTQGVHAAFTRRETAEAVARRSAINEPEFVPADKFATRIDTELAGVNRPESLGG